jgi:hypothetical protein
MEADVTSGARGPRGAVETAGACAPSFWGRFGRVSVVAAVVGLAVLFSVPLCPFAIVTRHPCPGCGLTRATLALARGDVTSALHFHPLAPVVVPLVVGAIVYNTFVYLRAGKSAATESLQGRWITLAGIALAALMVGVWIARFFGAFGGPVPV